MTDREFFVKTVEDEIPRFDRVFKALPTDKLDWQPHERSKSARELAVQMAVEGGVIGEFLKLGSIDFANLPAEKMVKDFQGAAEYFQKGLKECASIAKDMSEADWSSPAAMLMGGKSVWDSTKGGLAWGFLLDLIHHRGQLSVYLRPMGGKVPSIYGPSGDSTE